MRNKVYLRPTIIPLEREFGETIFLELITLLQLTTNIHSKINRRGNDYREKSLPRPFVYYAKTLPSDLFVYQCHGLLYGGGAWGV